MNDFSAVLGGYVKEFDEYAKKALSADNFSGRGSSGLDRMLDAMGYSLSNGGKRIRPVLALEFCRLCCGDAKKALPFALAVEMIHTYSLIHDDLPCMDDDDIRRGKPSNHVVYGYADALLAGDGLLTLAFEILAKADTTAEKKCEAVLTLSKAAGCSGMIAGQVMDLENENKTVSLDTVRATDALKTGELIRAAAMLGCIAGNADEKQRKAACEYCDCIGLAFQIVDDILDVTGDTETLGKPVGSDSENQKSTYVSLLGLDGSKALVASLTEKALNALDVFGDEADFLRQLATELSARKK